MSIVVGGQACNAFCPFCISKMTGLADVQKKHEVNLPKLRKAIKLAQIGGVTTVLLTGKGEPTLYDEQINVFLKHLELASFPFIELQTNGLRLAENPEMARLWAAQGLTTVIISVVHYEAAKNQIIYTPNKSYIDLPVLIKHLHSMGLIVRLNCTMIKDFIDTIDETKRFLQFCQDNQVDQVSLRPVTTPVGVDECKQYLIANAAKHEIFGYLQKSYPKIMNLMHGAEVYDADGVSLCLTNCLTESDGNELRQIIFYPNGKLTYSWQYQGATLLRGNE